MYTAGYESVHQSWPTFGLDWMIEPHNSRRARQYCWRAVQQVHDIQLNLVIDCMDIQTRREERPVGHLGFHSHNLALCLAHESNKLWRARQYTKIWLLLQTTEMVPESREIHFLTFCRQGKHRSVMFFMLCAQIFSALGFKVIYANTCAWAQMKSRCQRNAGCPCCSKVRESLYSWAVYENAVYLQDLAVWEFFQVVCCLEACATQTNFPGMDE